MSRHRYLVTYDISDDKRRTKVFKTLYDEGDHVQYSVFLCELDRREVIALRTRLDACIHHREDQILFLDIGPTNRLPDTFLWTLGRSYEPPCPVIVV